MIPLRTRPSLAVDVEKLSALQNTHATSSELLRRLSAFSRDLLDAGGVEALPASVRESFSALVQGALEARTAVYLVEDIECHDAYEALCRVGRAS